MTDNQHKELLPRVSSGSADVYPLFASRYIKPRQVTVWLPDGYKRGDKCAVLYMHDGQMLFDEDIAWNHQTWQVDKTVGGLIAGGRIRPCIVVAIDNTDERLREYFPDNARLFLPDSLRCDIDLAHHSGNAYLKFVVSELKPFIERTYDPLTAPEDTFIMGSSMGGLISLYALCEYPQVFGGAACLSTHLSMQNLDMGDESEAWADAFRSYVRRSLPPSDAKRVYMDRGSVGLDGSYGPYQDRMDDLFRELQWDDVHFSSQIFAGHEHMETYWAQRLHLPLIFLLGTNRQVLRAR